MAGQKTDERDLHIGRRLTEQRKRAKLTQREVAGSFGMSAAQLQKYEKGVNRISAVHLAILSRLTGTPVAEFLDGLPHLDEVPASGFAEDDQEAYTANDPWSGLARVVARHVTETFDETSRREFASAINMLNRALNT